MSGIAWTPQPRRPIDTASLREFELFAPTIEMEFHLRSMTFVGDGEKRLVGNVSRSAGVCVEVGLLVRIARHGIALNVKQGLAVLRAALDEFRVEMVMPEVAGGMVEAVDVSRMLALEKLHEARNGTAAEWFEHEVDMVRHEAECVNSYFVATGQDVETIEIEDGVGGADEGRLALGAALVDVVNLSAFPFADARRVGLRSHVY